MGRPLASADALATPERLLDAAEQSFARAGFGAARLEDIAAAAGIRRPSLLYHYPSKGSLYAAVVRRTFTRLGAALMQAMARPVDFVARLEGVVTTYAGFLAEHPAHAQILVRELIDPDGPGREILLGEVVPLLNVLERFVGVEGHGVVRPDLPVRAAILQCASGIVLRSAAGALQGPLWGPVDHAGVLARVLFFGPSRSEV
ncbi:MAG TPA: TetR family transcriptional regulator [Nannocystis sp.]|jgi:AcrR family transcriptional regulator